MNEKTKLTLQMAIFTFIIFVAFGVIIVTEKAAPYLSTQVDKKLNEYLKTNYEDIINDLKIGNTNYEKTIYKLKLTSLTNKNLYFYINYSEKKITDTYKEDYLQGKTLLSKLQKNLEKELQSKYNQEISVEFLTTLDKFSNQIKEKVLKEDNISSLPIYSIETTIKVEWTQEEIVQALMEFHKKLETDNVNPKKYIFFINDKSKNNKPIKIYNLEKKHLEDQELLTKIINDIITGKNSKILKENNITYKQI